MLYILLGGIVMFGSNSVWNLKWNSSKTFLFDQTIKLKFIHISIKRLSDHDDKIDRKPNKVKLNKVKKAKQSKDYSLKIMFLWTNSSTRGRFLSILLSVSLRSNFLWVSVSVSSSTDKWAVREGCEEKVEETIDKTKGRITTINIKMGLTNFR